MPQLLLELFSEEIPARMQAAAARDLERLVVGGLTDRGFLNEGARSFATPRRLALAAQFIGLVGIAVWSAARVSQLTDMTSTRLPAQAMVLHISMACYAIGTAWKVWLHRAPSNGDGGDTVPMEEAPHKLEPGQMRQVAGGKQ